MNDKIKLYYPKDQLDENSLQAMLNHIRRMNQCDILEVIYSGEEENIDKEKRSEIIKKKINDAVVKAYPNYLDNRTEVDNLFFVFTSILQYSDATSSVALGKMLQYIDYIKENMAIEVKRQMGAYLLENTRYPSTLPFALKGTANKANSVVKGIQKIQDNGLKNVREQIAFANINKDAVGFYEHSTKVEIDLINAMLKYLKEAGKAFKKVDDKIANSTNASTEARYINMKRDAVPKIRRDLAEIEATYRANVENYGSKSILVNLLYSCCLTFVKYFETHDTLEDIEWFINDYLTSANTYDRVVKNEVDELEHSSFGYNFSGVELQAITLFNNRQLKTINYDNIKNKLRLNKGSSR